MVQHPERQALGEGGQLLGPARAPGPRSRTPRPASARPWPQRWRPRATEAEAGHKPDAVEVTYFRDQAMHDEFGREEGPFGVTNANARAAARALRADGYDVVFRYPSDAVDA